MQKNKKNLIKKGFGIIEIIIAAAIISLALASLGFLGNFAIRIQTHLKQNQIATNLAVEAMEAAKAVRNESWTNFSALPIDTAYHPEKGGVPLKWSLVAGVENINGFSRHIIFSQVLRDADFDIAENGTPDPNTRKIVASVFWNEKGKMYQVDLVSYLTNWR